MNTFPARFAALVLAPLFLLMPGCDDNDSESSGSGTLQPGRYTITFYYTPVESFFTGPLQAITGCTSIDCASGLQSLGAFPSDFIAAVQMQGSGRITSGPYAGNYLCGSFSDNFWIHPFPPDAYGSAARAFVTAAADDNVLAPGTRFRLVAPLAEAGGPIPDSTANKLLSSTWTVSDHFQAGYGGSLHIDLYVGEQTTPSFTSSPYYLLLENVAIEVF